MSSRERALVNMDTYTDFPAFIKAHKGKIFHYWIYRRVFTPYEQKECFIDESVFEDTHANSGIIMECIPLGNGDFLLGFQPVDDSDLYNITAFDFVEYYKLSEIRLRRSIEDNGEE